VFGDFLNGGAGHVIVLVRANAISLLVLFLFNLFLNSLEVGFAVRSFNGPTSTYFRLD